MKASADQSQAWRFKPSDKTPPSTQGDFMYESMQQESLQFEKEPSWQSVMAALFAITLSIAVIIGLFLYIGSGPKSPTSKPVLVGIVNPDGEYRPTTVNPHGEFRPVIERCIPPLEMIASGDCATPKE